MKHVALMLALCVTGTAFAQTYTADNFYQVRYWVNSTTQPSNVRIVNTGANGAALSGPETFTTCANLYAFATNGQLTSCCTCPVPSNGLVSLPVQNNFVPFGNSVPSALVFKMIATGPNASGVCAGAATAGLAGSPLVTGLLSWITTGAEEYAFSPSTLSAGELAKATGLCATLNTPIFCKSCPAP